MIVSSVQIHSIKVQMERALHESMDRQRQQRANPVVVSAVQLAEDFRANEESALQRYGVGWGTWVQASGEVIVSQSDSGIILEGSNSLEIECTGMHLPSGVRRGDRAPSKVNAGGERQPSVARRMRIRRSSRTAPGVKAFN